MFWTKKPANKHEKQEIDREALIAQTQKHMRQVREDIGEEKLAELAAHITGKKPPSTPSPREQAKKILLEMDSDKIAHGILDMLREERP